MSFVQHRLRGYTTAVLSAMSWVFISHQAMAQSLPPAAQVGDLMAHEICSAVADGWLNEQATDADFERVLQQAMSRVEMLYGAEMSIALSDQLDTVFASPGPPLDPYFMEGLQNFLRFLSTDTACYTSIYTFMAEPSLPSTIPDAELYPVPVIPDDQQDEDNPVDENSTMP